MVADVWESGQVVRYHTNPTVARIGQTTADHSWGVATIIVMLHPDPSRELILAALFHDSGERWAGDLPAPFKRRRPDFAKLHSQIEAELANEKGVPQVDLTEVEMKWLSLADRLEAFLFMRLHGQRGQWTHDHLSELTGLARELGVFNEVLNLIGAN